MPPRKKAETIKVPEKATLYEGCQDRIRFMSEGITDHKALAHVLTQRALTAVALANEEFAKAGKGDVYGPAIEKDAAFAALAMWEPEACLGNLRQFFVNYKLTPPEDRLAVWLKMAKDGVAGVILPDGFDPFGAPAEDFIPNAESPSPVGCLAPAEPETLTAVDLAALDQDTRTMGELQRAYGEDRDLANQLLGQTQMAQAFGKFAQAISFTKLQIIKERKLYRALSGVTGRDHEGKTIEDLGTWEGYCRALGLSRSKVDEDLLNLKVFGQEAMEALAKAGAGYRELRAMRALPEGEREAIAAEAARATTREELLDLLDEVQTRNAAKQEALNKENEDLKLTLEARDKVLEDKAKLLTRREEELEKLKKLPPAENLRLKLEVEKQAVDDLNVKSIDAIAALNGLMSHVEEIMAADVSLHTRTYCEDTVRMFAETFTDLLARHGINVDFQGMAAPAWDKTAAKDDIKAGRTGA